MYTVDIDDAELKAALNRLRAHLSDFTEVFQVIGDSLEDSTHQRIEQGVTPEGGKFSPKAQATLDAYERRGQTVNVNPLFGPNVDGDDPLRRSFFSAASSDQLEIGTNKIQAAVMQFGAKKGAFGTASNGSSIPWGNIPARPYLGISTEDRQMIAITIEEWLGEVDH